VLAAAVADVLIGDDHPPVPARVGDHPLEQAPVGLLDIGLPAELDLSVAQARRERVADALELTGLEHPWATDRSDAPLESAARDGRGEELAEASLEVRDLPAQVGPGQPLRALGDLGPDGESGAFDLIENCGQGTLLPARRLRAGF
jgi:hypothetical protein